MTFWPSAIFIRAALLSCVVGALFGCDRGIAPFDPDETPSAPNLDRIYPEGARQPMRPESAGMPNPAAPSRRGEPPIEVPDRVSGETITGRVMIDDALKAEGPKSGMLFIIARKQPTGPPLAVLRVPNPSFPVSFEIGQAQVMIPTMQFDGEITLSARLDSDGNAMTRLPGDFVGEVAGTLRPGARDVVLSLDGKL